MNTVKGIIFDYGGTIDTNGTHWAEVIREQYIKAGLAIDDKLFRETYIYGERALSKNPIIEPTDTFCTLLEKKIAIHCKYLNGTMSSIQEKIIAQGCYLRVLDTMEKTRSVVESLSRHYPMVLVTNFYGNMPTVLKEFALEKFFIKIVESSVVGIRKPDPALFALGVEALSLPSKDVVVIGDSYRKDIFPAHTLGCRTVWIKGIGWEEETPQSDALPDATIKSLEELPTLLLNH